MANLWCPNELPCAFDASSLCPSRAVETHVPSLFDPVLEVEDRGDPIGKMLMARTLRFRNVRDQDLDVAVAAEPALSGHLADMAGFGTTEKSALDGLVLLAQFGKHGDEVVCFIVDNRVSCQSPIIGNPSLLRGSAALLQHLVQPRRHLFLMCMGSQFRTLTLQVSACSE